VHQGLERLGYAPEDDSFDHLAAAGEWLLAGGFRRIDRTYAAERFEVGYPPRSPYFESMRRLRIPPSSLLVRRTEVSVLRLLGELEAGADWGAITAEHHSGAPVSTALGREDRSFFG
jgi:hypothetical protein